MPLDTRVHRLERLNPIEKNCAGCGYPRSTVTSVLAIDVGPTNTCALCGRLLAPDGRPLANQASVIILHDLPQRPTGPKSTPSTILSESP